MTGFNQREWEKYHFYVYAHTYIQPRRNKQKDIHKPEFWSLGADKGLPEGGEWEKGFVIKTSRNSTDIHALGYLKAWASELTTSEW